MQCWTSFAARGVPSGKDSLGHDLPVWPAWTVGGQKTLDLGPRIRVLKDHETQACDVVERLYAAGAGD